MKIRLMNSAMMPQAGYYHAERIDFASFKKILKEAVENGMLVSYIGYEQNVKLIKAWTGKEVALNRSRAVLQDGDQILVMKLTYRVPNPADKGKEVNEEDFEFFLVDYYKEAIK